MGGNVASPCASCKLLRRRCSKDCIFSPYFPSHDPHKFAIVHKVFGASNISKLLQELPLEQRADAVSSLVYEASARMRDPVYGCVGAISHLQNEVSQLQMQLAIAEAEILCIQMQRQPPTPINHNNNLPYNDVNSSLFLDSHNQQQQQHYQVDVNSSSSTSAHRHVIQDHDDDDSFKGVFLWP